VSSFNTVVGSLLGSVASGGAHPGLAGEVLNMIGGAQGGGIASLVRAFEGHGLGGIIESWIGSGRNVPIGADQLTSVLGQGQVNQLAARYGLAPEAVASQLSQLLPKIIDGLTPHGSIPDTDVLQEGLSLLRSKLG
jgi:uncharacterized protein YidB (DUF937 family)